MKKPATNSRIPIIAFVLGVALSHVQALALDPDQKAAIEAAGSDSGALSAVATLLIQEKPDAAVEIIEAAIAKNPASAPEIAATTATLYPSLAVAAVKAAANAAPELAPVIAGSVAAVAPSIAAEIAAAVVAVAPENAAAIVAVVSRASGAPVQDIASAVDIGESRLLANASDYEAGAEIERVEAALVESKAFTWFARDSASSRDRRNRVARSSSEIQDQSSPN